MADYKDAGVDPEFGETTGQTRAMEAVIGVWKDRDDFAPTEDYIRQLRRGERRRVDLIGPARFTSES